MQRTCHVPNSIRKFASPAESKIIYVLIHVSRVFLRILNCTHETLKEARKFPPFFIVRRSRLYMSNFQVAKEADIAGRVQSESAAVRAHVFIHGWLTTRWSLISRCSRRDIKIHVSTLSNGTAPGKSIGKAKKATITAEAYSERVRAFVVKISPRPRTRFDLHKLMETRNKEIRWTRNETNLIRYNDDSNSPTYWCVRAGSMEETSIIKLLQCISLGN